MLELVFKEYIVRGLKYMSTLSIESNVKVVNLYKDILSPLEQFEIRDLLSLDALGNLHISITNIGFYLTVGAFFIFMLNILSTNYNKLVSNT
jgi:F-type H+-transporting ATPase subunit a